LSSWLVVDRREAPRAQADDNIVAAHFDVEAIDRGSVHAGHRSTRLRGTICFVQVDAKAEPRPQGAVALLTLGILRGKGRDAIQTTEN
jgi:hypothetical protein